MQLVLILVQNLLSFFVDSRLLARIDVASTVLDNCTELIKFVFKFLNVFFYELLVLF